MKIEKIERSKHKQERVLVYLEGGDLLRITESELLRFGLCIGLDIDDRTVVELQQSGARSETRVRAANMISSRPLSRKELSKKLREKGSVEADAESACDWLEEIGALNDAEYAAMLVRHYGGMGYGEAKIRDELYRRGIPRELWDDAMQELPEQDEQIDALLRRRLRSDTPDRDELRRASDYLYRRGFGRDEIRAAIARYQDNFEEY